MDGNQLLAQMKRLSEAETIKDVRPLTAAMFPGTHCPLMGAAMAVRGISDAMMLIIGTDDCTYYTKHFSIHADNFGGLNGRCVSVALDGHDVTFGCARKVEEAFDEMMAEYHPQAAMTSTRSPRACPSAMTCRSWPYIPNTSSAKTTCLASSAP